MANPSENQPTQLIQRPNPTAEAIATQYNWPDSSLALDPEAIVLARIYAVLRQRAQEAQLAQQAATLSGAVRLKTHESA